MQETLVTDIELVNSMAEGDENAFREIYRRYWYKLYTVAKRKVDSEEDAEEVIQDIFVDLWERRLENRINDLNNFLFTAVKYKALNLIKAKIVRYEFANGIILVSDEADMATEEHLAFEDLKAAIAFGTSQMPLKTQEIFRLNRLDGLSVKEISVSLSIPERTIEYHITQSLRIMRTHLKDFVILSALLLLSIQ